MASRGLIRAAAAERRSRLTPGRLQLVALLVLVVAWEIVARSRLARTGVAPSLLDIGGALVDLAGSARFWSNLAITGAEIALAILCGGALGTGLGILVGTSRIAAAVAEPIVNALTATPKVVFLPLLYLVFGLGMGSKIAAGTLACALPMLIGVTTAMLQLNPAHAKVGRSFDLSWRQMAAKIYLPALREPIVNTLRVAGGAAIVVCLIAEMRFSFGGLGLMVIDAFNRSRFAQVYAVLAIIIAFAVGFDALLSRIGRGWRRREMQR
jgi:ABC-type nitrate/sulfonate/bicarbonate transport system permease component